MTSETPSSEAKPTRWLHVRHRGGFTDEQWSSFQAHCRYFEACANALLTSWVDLGKGDRPLEYLYFPPELSEDRTVATLPLGGDQTLGSRAAIENGHAELLWCYLLRCMPIEDFVKLEEGLTEPHLTDPSKLGTNWRPAHPQQAEPQPSKPPYAAELSIALSTLSRLVPPPAIAPALFRLLWLVGAPVPPPLFLAPRYLFGGLFVLLTSSFLVVMAAFAPWLAEQLPSMTRLLLTSAGFGATGAAALTVMYRQRVRRLNLPILQRERPDA